MRSGALVRATTETLRSLRRARSVVAGWTADQVYRWRASLQLRVITSTLVVGIAALAVLGAFLSDRIRDGLYEQRVRQLLAESARSTQQAQETFFAADASTGGEVQQMFSDLVPALQVGQSGERREVFLSRSPAAEVIPFATGWSTDPELEQYIPDALRSAVRSSDLQQWVPVGVPSEQDEGFVVPAVVVGSAVTVPTAGQFELYYLYRLDAEQQTLVFLQQVLAVAAASLVVLLGAMTWFVTRQAVQPVRSAARIAERLADGLLAERMTVKGVDEMATLARSFNEMAESLQDQIRRMEMLSRLQRRFVSDVSHELRTPLTTIRMAAEVIHASRDLLDPGAARSAELLATQLDRFEVLLADLLEMSRFDAGAAMLDAESRDVRDVVVGAVDQAAPIAARRGVWLSVELPEAPVVADVDPRRVERILRNLFINAVEHADGRPVQIRLACDSQALAITVRDHGVGMTPEEVAHVFDRFWRADPARARTTGGTGLGLAISLEDAHLHGGWLQAWGRPGKGASFRLTLPLRAGIILTGSPLSLAPADAPAPKQAGPEKSLDPAGVPDLDRLEA